MATDYFYRSTTNPPADDDEEHVPWTLLELMPYVAKRENAATACCDSWDGKEIQVTLCARPPPRVSYLCVHSPRDDMATEPEIIATDKDLIVLRVTFGSQEDLNNLENVHYYVYQAGDDGPSLKHLPRIPHCLSSFDAADMGILRYATNNDKGYIVAGIVEEDGSLFTIYLYDFFAGQQGEEACWTTHTVSLNHEHQQRYYCSDAMMRMRVAATFTTRTTR